MDPQIENVPRSEKSPGVWGGRVRKERRALMALARKAYRRKVRELWGTHRKIKQHSVTK
jgi:hypothetical protein